MQFKSLNIPDRTSHSKPETLTHPLQFTPSTVEERSSRYTTTRSRGRGTDTGTGTGRVSKFGISRDTGSVAGSSLSSHQHTSGQFTGKTTGGHMPIYQQTSSRDKTNDNYLESYFKEVGPHSRSKMSTILPSNRMDMLVNPA